MQLGKPLLASQLVGARVETACASLACTGQLTEWRPAKQEAEKKVISHYGVQGFKCHTASTANGNAFLFFHDQFWS